MQIVEIAPCTQSARPLDPSHRADLEQYLRRWVEKLAVPRNLWAERQTNHRIGDVIANELASLGYQVTFEGPFRNVVAWPRAASEQPVAWVGAHYDSVPGSPGADDNASGVAVLLASAGVLAKQDHTLPVGFVAFNGEEDGLCGSLDFVARSPTLGRRISEVHVLEMLGFRSYAPNSQRVPGGLPLRVPSRGDFLGLLASSPAHASVRRVLAHAHTPGADLHVLALKTYLGIDRAFPHLHRSDHSPFWRVGIPAVLWTDTAEFRNPHYHRASDRPETLDYGFMAQIAELLVATLCARSAAEAP